MIIDQDKIDLYYQDKKNEVSDWLIEYTTCLKKTTKEQKATLLDYAQNTSFTTIGRLYAYVQKLSTISNRDKKKLEKYLQEVDWLPKDVTAGFLDGKLVCRTLPSTIDENIIRTAFGPQKGEDDDPRNRSDAESADGVPE